MWLNDRVCEWAVAMADLVYLGQQVAVVLASAAPYLEAGGKGIAGAVGKSTWEQTVRWLQDRFQARPQSYEAQTWQRWLERPQDPNRQQAVVGVLKEMAVQDPTFAQALQQQLGQGSGAQVMFETTVSDSASVGNLTNIGQAESVSISGGEPKSS